MWGGGKTKTISVTVTESSLPFARQATSTSSLGFLVIALFGIAASVFIFGCYRASRRELEAQRRSGQGGESGRRDR